MIYEYGKLFYFLCLKWWWHVSFYGNVIAHINIYIYIYIYCVIFQEMLIWIHPRLFILYADNINCFTIYLRYHRFHLLLHANLFLLSCMTISLMTCTPFCPIKSFESKISFVLQYSTKINWLMSFEIINQN